MENNSKNNTDNKKVESSQNNTLKVDISKLKRIEKGGYNTYETYEMLIDEDGNEYELDGTPVKKRPKNLDKDTLQKMIESGELKLITYVYNCDMCHVYVDKNDNTYSLNGVGLY
jgi:hypothetical protein